MIKKIFTFIFVVLISSFALANEKVSLQLQWKYQFQFAGYIMAKERGFYDELGLDVEIREWEKGIDMIEEVVQKRTTFAIARPTSFINNNTVEHIRFLGAIFQSSPLVLLADKSSGIKSISDFKNKTLMSTGDLNSDASLVSMMYSQGVDFNNLSIVDPSFNVKDLLTGKTDLIASYISNEPYILKQLGGDPIVFDPKDYGFDFYNDIVITNSTLIKNNPQMVQEFMDATLQGWKCAFENIEETAQIIYDKYNSQNKSLDALIYEGEQLKPLALNKKDELGDISAVKMQRIYDIYRLLGLTQVKDIDFDQLIYKPTNKSIYLTLEEREYLKNNIFTVGISLWQPFVSYDENKENIDGIVIEILDLLIERLNLQVEYVPNPWDKNLQDFKDNKIDILPATSYTDERATYGHYSKPYMKTKENLYVHEDSKIKGFEDLKGKTLAIMRKYDSVAKIKKRYPKIKIIEVDTLEQLVQKVLNKEVDALFNTQFTVESFLLNNHIYDIKPIYQSSFKPSAVHYFTQKDDTTLQSIIEKGIKSLSTEEVESIMSHWTQKSIASIYSLREQRYIQNNKKIKVCTNPNWTPIEFTNGENKPNGISIDTLKLVSEKTGFEFEFIPTKSWTQSQEFLEQKKCDILPAAIATTKRKKYANFTNPYLSYNLAIITTDDKPLVENIEQVVSKTMSRKKDSGLISLLKTKYPDIDIKETQGYKDAFEMVAEGKAYFTIATLPVLSYYKNKYDFENLQVAGYTNMKYNLSIAVRDDQNTLLKVLDKALAQITDEQKKLIHEKWINKDIQTSIDYDLIFQILLVVGIILIFIVYKQIVLRNSVKEFEELINATMEGVLILKNNKCIDLNESALNILGYQNKEEIVGKSILDFVPKESQPFVKQNLKTEQSTPYELNIPRKDGVVVPLLVRGKNIKNGTLRLVSIVDITIIKQQEEQLLQQAKLVSMGEMIGNIAHQWRQPLSVISTSASGIKVQKEYGILEDSFLFEACDSIDHNVQYLSQTIDDFRDFIKGDRFKRRFSIEEFIQSFIHLIEASAKSHDIQLIKDIEKDFVFEGYENELKQCFMNIYNNSKDILIEKNPKQKLFVIKISKKDSKVIFSFTDNGGGISKEAMPNIFDPYFTTKHKSQGTGLGLSMTYNLITQGMDGTIKASNEKFVVDNKEYYGAEFRIILSI
jgi:polar amino acid transport system substrate-binding protein